MADTVQFVFISNYINHHQIPFCNAMYKLLQGDFLFIQTEAMEQERINMGWQSEVEVPYLRRYYEEPDKCQGVIDSCGVALFGGVEDESYITKRLHNGLPVIRYCERLYKTGQWKAISPRGLLRKYKDHTKYRRRAVYLLCAGAYVASDFHIVRAYPGKMLRWGYFPETRHYEDIEALMDNKQAGNILWAARFLDWKHPELPLKTAKWLKDKGLRFHMDIIGGGEEEAMVRRLYEEYNLRDCVTLQGYKTPEEVRGFMERADIFLITSDRNEGWGAVVNEAMNSGCAVIGNHMIGAVPFLVEHGKNGYIYQDGHEEQLYHMTEQLLQNRPLCRSLGREAMQTIFTEWNSENAALRLVEFCRRQGFLDIGTGAEESEQFPKTGPGSPAPVISERKMYSLLISGGDKL